MFNDAAQLMYEAWFYMPQALILDLLFYHIYLRKRGVE